MRNKNNTLMIINISIIFMMILMFVFVIFGADYHFHLDRLGAMVEELRINPLRIPIRILGDSYNGYGYGAPLFYGDVLFYIPAYLTLFGLKLIISYKLIIIAIFVLTFISMYRSSFITFQNKNISLIIAALYVFSPYYLIDLCIRQALGEAQAFIFIPIAVFSFYRLINDSKRKEFLYLGLGMLGIVLSHNLTFVLIVFVLLIWFFIDYKKTFNKKVIINVLKASLITILLSSSFTLPMIEAIASQSYHYQIEDTMTKSEFVRYVLNVKDLIMPDEVTRGLNMFFGIGESIEVWKPGAVGLNFIILIILVAVRRKELNKLFKYLFGIVVFTYVFLMTKPLINFASYFLSFMQFPWRLLIIPSFIIPILLGVLIEKEKNIKNYLLVLLITCGLFSVLPRYAYQAYIQFKGKEYAISLNKNYATDYTFSYNKNNLDYLYIPKESSTHLYEERVNGAFSGSEQIHIKRDGNVITIEQYRDDQEIELPIYYYKGYVAKSGDTELRVYKSENGLVSINTTDANGQINIYYKGTTIQSLSNLVSTVSAIILIFVLKIIS